MAQAAGPDVPAPRCRSRSRRSLDRSRARQHRCRSAPEGSRLGRACLDEGRPHLTTQSRRRSRPDPASEPGAGRRPARCPIDRPAPWNANAPDHPVGHRVDMPHRPQCAAHPHTADAGADGVRQPMQPDRRHDPVGRRVDTAQPPISAAGLRTAARHPDRIGSDRDGRLGHHWNARDHLRAGGIDAQQANSMDRGPHRPRAGRQPHNRPLLALIKAADRRGLPHGGLVNPRDAASMCDPDRPGCDRQRVDRLLECQMEHVRTPPCRGSKGAAR